MKGPINAEYLLDDDQLDSVTSQGDIVTGHRGGSGFSVRGGGVYNLTKKFTVK